MAFRWPESAARVATRLIPCDVLWYVETDRPVFALTFDDGPSPDTTPGLLEVLARHQATATFFLIGERARAQPELVRDIVAAGHELGNHMMRDERSATLPIDRFRSELAEVNALLAPYGRVRWFRPGSGWFTPSMLRAAAGVGLRAVLGTLAAAHDGGPGDAEIVPWLRKEVRPGSIAVLHEGGRTRHGVVAGTDELLAGLAGRGLAAVTVAELASARRA